MKNHAFKEWVFATRPWSFPASAMPVLVTIMYLFWKGVPINWFYGVWALAGIVIFHASGNTLSDYFDYKHNVDANDTYGNKTLTSGQFAPNEILALSMVLLIVAVASGIGLLLCTGMPLLWIGIGAVICTTLYSPLKFNALGDLVIYMAYGFLPTLGTSYVVGGAFDWSVLWHSVPVGLITIGILHSNNTRDISTDGRAGIKTLAMVIGKNASVVLYGFEVLFPFIWVAVCAVAGIFPWWSLLVLPALLAALKNTKQMFGFAKGGMKAISDVDVKTAQLQLVFSLLFSISFVVAYFL